MPGQRRTPSRIIARAVARGAISQARAQFWLAQAADGRDISCLDQFWAPDAATRRVMARADSAAAVDPDDPEGIFAALFPPRTAAEFDARRHVSATAPLSAAELTEAELYERLFVTGDEESRIAESAERATWFAEQDAAPAGGSMRAAAAGNVGAEPVHAP